MRYAHSGVISCYRTCHSSCLKPRTAPSARGVPIPMSIMHPAVVQCSLRIAPATCDPRSCHTFCLKPESPPTAHGILIPTANLQTSWRSSALYRNCHGTCLKPSSPPVAAGSVIPTDNLQPAHIPPRSTGHVTENANTGSIFSAMSS